MLQLARRFESTHHLFPNARWLVRILSTVVKPFVLAVLKLQTHIFVRGRVALELLGDQNSWGDAALSESLSHQSLSCFPITAALH